MSLASSPSKISLPQNNPGVVTVLEYLILRFPLIPRETWEQRILGGKVHWHDGTIINKQTQYAPQQRVYYYREVSKEPVVPFEEEIVFQDELLVVAHKPHFLPVTPGGEHVEECLQSRLRKKTGIDQLQAMHRIDKATAGLVLFSKIPETRQYYHHLFESRQVKKTYQAISNTIETQPEINQKWEIKNRIERTGTRFLMHVVDGPANSHSLICCLQRTNEKALFELNPITGRTHQLRLHMNSLGWPILNDKYYPKLLTSYDSENSETENYNYPLQLLAQKIQFTDPVTREDRYFCSNTSLTLS